MSVGFKGGSRSRSRRPLCSHGVSTAVLMRTSRAAPIIIVEAQARSGKARVRSHLSEPQSLHQSLSTTKRTRSLRSLMRLDRNSNNSNSCLKSSGIRFSQTRLTRDKLQPMERRRPSIKATLTVCHQFNTLDKRREPVVITGQPARPTRYAISRRTTRMVPSHEAR